MVLRFRLASTFAALAGFWIPAAAQSPDLEAIVARLERAQVENRNSIRAYSLTRQFHLSDGNGQNSSAVTAEVSFVPPGRKSFTIQSSEGSDRGEKVVRKVLEGESQMAAGAGHSDLTRENYEFTYLGLATATGRPCWLLAMEPRKDRKDLIRGNVCVDTRNYLPRRVEGVLAKTPSWWLKKVTVTLDFDDVRGMWLQTATEAIADVRLFGKHELRSRVVASQAAEALAHNAPPVLPNRVSMVPAGADTSASAPKTKLKKATLKKSGKRALPRKALASKNRPAATSIARKQPATGKQTALLGTGVLAP